MADELLITLVEGRPVLWDKTLDIYKDKRLTYEAWREIFIILNIDFDDMTNVKKNEYAKSIAKKWTTLRDRWMKCHKKLKEMKSGSGAKKIRKCDFYDEMLFLTKVATHRDTESNIPEKTYVEKSPVEHTPIAKKKKQDDSDMDKNMAEFIKTVTKEEESRAMSFFKSIAPSVDKFIDEEMVDFQFEVLTLVRATQQRKASDVHHQWRTEYYKTTQPSTSSFNVSGPSYLTRPGQKSTSIEFDTETLSSVETSQTEEFDFDFSKEYEHLESVEFGNM